MADKKESGFFDLEKEIQTCTDPEHRPPMHMVIPAGKGYKHVCPSCGTTQIIIPPNITL